MVTAKASKANSSSTPVTDKVTDSMHNTVDSVSEHAEKTEEKIRATASHSAENIKEKTDQAKAIWNSSSVKRYMNENPVASAGIAFTVGALLSSLLLKKK